jgi:hypothetical protein
MYPGFFVSKKTAQLIRQTGDNWSDMAIAANSRFLQIARARTTHEIPLERFVTPEMRSIIAPDNPQSVMVCQYADALCIYDRSRTVSFKDVDSWFSYHDSGEFAIFSELAAPRGKLYAPVFYYSAGPISDEMYYDGFVELVEPMRGQKVAKNFYVNIETILCECGFRFLGGWHDNLDAATFFIRGGRLFLEEMIDGSHRDALVKLDAITASFMIGSVRCLQEDDEALLVKPELRGATLDERLSLLERVMNTKTLLMYMMADRADRVPSGARESIKSEILQALQSRGIDMSLTVPTTSKQSMALINCTFDIATRFTRREIDEFIFKLKTFIA